MDRGFVTTATQDGELVADRCPCPAGVALEEVPTLGQLDEGPRKLLAAIATSVSRSLVIRPLAKTVAAEEDLVGKKTG